MCLKILKYLKTPILLGVNNQFGAPGRTRTDTSLVTLDFESSASTISPQWHIAYIFYYKSIKIASKSFIYSKMQIKNRKFLIANKMQIFFKKQEKMVKYYYEKPK